MEKIKGETMAYSEGILGNGAVILHNGTMVPIEDIVKKLNKLDELKTALIELLNEVELSGNSNATDYGWPKALKAARDALGHNAVLSGKPPTTEL